MSEGEVPVRAGPGWQRTCLPAGPAVGVRPPGAAGGERVPSKNSATARSVKCRLRRVINSREATLWS